MPRTLPYSPIKRALGKTLGEAANAESTLASEHELVTAMLREVEALADGLPDLPPPSTLEAIVAYLRHGVPAHCRSEEAALDDAKTDEAARAREIIRREHTENDAVALEFAELIEECLETAAVPHPETLGHLARQYFMLMRRHMAWEEFVVETLMKDQS